MFSLKKSLEFEYCFVRSPQILSGSGKAIRRNYQHAAFTSSFEAEKMQKGLGFRSECHNNV